MIDRFITNTLIAISIYALYPHPADLVLNSIRDILQIEGCTWILVGESGLRNFFADNEDRFDDIISYYCVIDPLPYEEVLAATQAWVQKYAFNANPINLPPNDLTQVLYSATNGIIDQIYGFAIRLNHSIENIHLIEQITPDIAFSIIKIVVADRIRQNSYTKKERPVLEKIALSPNISPSLQGKETGLSLPTLSRVLSHLLKSRLVTFKQKGRSRNYTVALDMHVAFTELD